MGLGTGTGASLGQNRLLHRTLDPNADSNPDLILIDSAHG